MFLEFYNFIFNWLFGGGLPSFLTLNVAEWVSFGLTCAIILVGIVVISYPLIWFIRKIFEW